MSTTNPESPFYGWPPGLEDAVRDAFRRTRERLTTHEIQTWVRDDLDSRIYHVAVVAQRQHNADNIAYQASLLSIATLANAASCV